VISKENALQTEDIFVGMLTPKTFFPLMTSFMIQILPWWNQSENEGVNDYDKTCEEPDNLIKDYKTTISYHEELQKMFSVYNSKLLKMISRAK